MTHARSWFTKARSVGLGALLTAMLAAPSLAHADLAPNAASQTGVLRQFHFESQSLNDRMGLGVNVANGNLVFEADDLHISGVTLDLQMSRFYNSQESASTSLGPGWSMGLGDGVNLTELQGGNVIFRGPSGYAVKFTNPHGNGFGGTTYDTPEGFDAVLNKMSDGTYQLKFKDREERYDFGTSGRLKQDLNLRTDQKITFTYSIVSGRLTQVTDTQNRTINLSYYTSLDFVPGDPRIGRLKSITVANGASTLTWGYEYDTTAAARLIKYTDPNNAVTQYHYNGQGRLSQIDDPTSPSAFTQIGYVGTTGQVASITRDAAPNGPGFTTTFDYNSSGGSPCSAGQTKTTVNAPRPSTDVDDITTYCVDDQGQVKKIHDARGNDVSLSYTSTGNVQSYGLASGGSFTANYDTQTGRLQKVTDPSGAQWQLNYNAGNSSFRPDSVIDAVGHTLDFSYTPDGLISQINSAGNDASSCGQGGVFVCLTWNDGVGTDDTGPKGTVQKATDGRGNVTKYFYTNGNLTKITYPPKQSGDPWIGDTVYGYDPLGRVTSIIDGRNIKRTIDYDNLDRVLDVLYPPKQECLDGGNDPTKCDSIFYSYDENGNLKARNDNRLNNGRSQGTDSYTYDNRNLLTDAHLRAVNGENRGITYGYDEAGNMTSLLNTAGDQNLGKTVYTYNPVNLVKTISQDGTSDTFTYAYNNDEQPNLIDYPSSTGVGQANRYADASGSNIGRITEVKATKTGASTPLVDLNYQYTTPTGNAGLVTQVADTVTGRTTAYSYNDPLGRLTEANESGGTSPADYKYTYDDASNIKKETVNGVDTNYGYNAVNELNTRNGIINYYNYDLNGNLTSVNSGSAFIYDNREHTIAITPQGGAEHDYDYADTDQTERVQDNGVWFMDSLLGTELEGLSATSRVQFVRNPDTGQVMEMIRPEGNYYFLSDQFGSVVAVTDAQGNVVARYRYEPYGETVSVTGASPPDNPIRFQNQWFDTATGLYKLGTRYYDPSVGRFTQIDPMNLVNGNLYAFAGDDPVNSSDPSGASPVGPYSCTLALDSCSGAYSETAVAYSQPTPVGPITTGGDEWVNDVFDTIGENASSCVGIPTGVGGASGAAFGKSVAARYGPTIAQYGLTAAKLTGVGFVAGCAAGVGVHYATK